MVKLGTLAIIGAGLGLLLFAKKATAQQAGGSPSLSVSPPTLPPVVASLNVEVIHTGDITNQPIRPVSDALNQLAGQLPTSGPVVAFTTFEAAALSTPIHGVGNAPGGGQWTVLGSGGYYFPTFLPA